jgi:hypothetical protein
MDGWMDGWMDGRRKDLDDCDARVTENIMMWGPSQYGSTHIIRAAHTHVGGIKNT